MKKVLIAVLTLTMLLAIAVTASAAKSNLYKIYNMPCEAIADNMLYQYHADTKNSVDKVGC